ncbi:hypothetical protein F5X98DRAFT_339572 [Xylaria grammica]|nr:hypothetical protein F5X98DRAFT_339572 [Xylaria grammica]
MACLKGRTLSANSAAFSSDGTRVVSRSDDLMFRIQDMAEKTARKALTLDAVIRILSFPNCSRLH